MRALLRELIADGWSQQKVAALLDRSQGWVSQVVAGTIVSVEADTIDRAVHGLDLDANYFTRKTLGADESYKAHRRRAAHVEYDDEAPSPHFEAFLKITNLDALGVTPDELEHVRRAPFRGGARSPLDYQRALLALLKLDDLPQPAGFAEAQARAKAHKDSKRKK